MRKMLKRIQRLKRVGRKKFEDATKEERIQLAMLIDTDGSINPCEGIYPHISVTGRSILPIVMWEKWGGYIGKYREEKGKKIGYEWEVNEQNMVERFLSAIRPYLIIKKPQAGVGLKMIKLLKKKPESYKEKLKSLGEELSRLNHAPPPDIDLKDRIKLELLQEYRESAN